MLITRASVVTNGRDDEGAMMHRRSFLGLLGAAALTPVVSGCNLVPGSGPNPAVSNAGTGKLTLGIIPIAHFSTMYLAQQEGLFQREGLSVEMQVIQNAAAMVPSVINGQLAIGTGSGTPFLNAVSRNVPISIAAPACNNPATPEEDTLGVVVADDSDIETIADLAGKTVALNAIGSQPHIALEKMLADLDTDLEDVDYAPMPMADSIAAVRQGRVAAAAIAEPFVTIADLEGLRHLSAVYSLAFEGSGVESVFYAANEVISARQDEFDAFSRATIEANQMANDDPQLAQSILTKYLDMDPDIAAAMVMPEFATDTQTSTLEGISDVMVKTGFLMEPIPGDRMVV